MSSSIHVGIALAISATLAITGCSEASNQSNDCIKLQIGQVTTLGDHEIRLKQTTSNSGDHGAIQTGVQLVIGPGSTKLRTNEIYVYNQTTYDYYEQNPVRGHDSPDQTIPWSNPISGSPTLDIPTSTYVRNSAKGDRIVAVSVCPA